MAVQAIEPTIVSLKEARDYLSEQQLDQDNSSNLQLLINSVTGWVYKWTGRKNLLVTATPIVEYVRGRGDNELQLAEQPITSLTTVETWPNHSGSGETITGPGVTRFNDDLWYEAETGQVFLKGRDLYDGPSAAKVTYLAGFEADSSEIAVIKGAILELLAFHWNRQRNKDQGIESTSKGDGDVSYEKDQDIDPAILRQLLPFKRRWTA